jgi:hypothetical protein
MADATGPTFGASEDYYFNDGSDSYANNEGTIIGFQHLPSKETVYFKAFITAFNETFTSDWAQESVYGRSDPIYMFKQTKRNINLAFKIPASSIKEAFDNLSRVQRLAQFLYPTYETPEQAQTITQSPLIRLKVMNLVRNVAAEGVSPAQDYREYGQAKSGGLLADTGVLGVISSVAVDHSLGAIDGVVHVAKGSILSKLIEVNMNFAVIHEHPLGWDGDGNFATPAFPYAADSPRTPAEIEAPAEKTPEDPLEGSTGPFISSQTQNLLDDDFEVPGLDPDAVDHHTREALTAKEAAYEEAKRIERGWGASSDLAPWER